MYLVNLNCSMNLIHGISKATDALKNQQFFLKKLRSSTLNLSTFLKIKISASFFLVFVSLDIREGHESPVTVISFHQFFTPLRRNALGDCEKARNTVGLQSPLILNLFEN